MRVIASRRGALTAVVSGYSSSPRDGDKGRREVEGARGGEERARGRTSLWNCSPLRGTEKLTGSTALFVSRRNRMISHRFTSRPLLGACMRNM